MVNRLKRNFQGGGYDASTWNTSKPTTALTWQSSQHQQTSLPQAEAEVAASQASATAGYDPGEGPRGGEEEDVSTVYQGPTDQALEVEELTEWDKIWKLAELEAADPKYLKSWAGQQMKAQGKGPGTKEWIDKFGVPSIVMTPTYYEGDDPKGLDYWKKDPIKTTLRTDEYGNEIGGQYIYSGLGKTLMDQYQGQQDFDYGTAKEAYWDDRAAQESIDQSQRTSWGGYDGGGGGGGGGTGYYGDPRRGNPVEQMANFYTPQANLQQAMVNVHGTPTVFAKRGGIVSLLELR